MEFPTRNTSAGGWKLWCTVKGPSCVGISAKDRDEPVVRNLSEVKSKTILLGVSSTDIPLQGTSTSSIPTAGGLGHIVSGVGELLLAKKALSGCARRKLKKARAWASKAGTGGIQQPGNAGAPKQGETPTETLKRPRSKGSTPTQNGQSTKKAQGLIRRL
jgi:hypothetical protein